MATPTISGIVATNNAAGTSIATVTFTEAVTAADLTGVSISVGTIHAVESSASTLIFTIANQTPSDTLTMDFASTNTIESDSTSDALAEDLAVAVTNSLVAAVNSVTQSAGLISDSAAIHTAVNVVARDTKTACRAAC